MTTLKKIDHFIALKRARPNEKNLEGCVVINGYRNSHGKFRLNELLSYPAIKSHSTQLLIIEGAEFSDYMYPRYLLNTLKMRTLCAPHDPYPSILWVSDLKLFLSFIE